MISYIKGRLTEKFEDAVVVEAGNIGYFIYVAASTFEALPKLNTEVRIYTYFHIRENAMELYGFLSRHDLDMFKLLIAVNGVGPKTALGVLSVLRPDALRLAIISGDAKKISRAPGIGAKTAQRIILDMKDKVHADELLTDSVMIPEVQEAITGVDTVAKEAAEALTALGYSSGEALSAVKKVAVADGMTSEDVLKAALKHLAFL